jgi:hypothetical protein
VTPTGQLAFGYALDVATSRDESWSTEALAWIRALPPGAEFSADSIRAHVGDPHGSGNAVGAVTKAALKSRLVAYTGTDVLSRRPEARGRYLRIWVRTNQ